MIEQNNGSQKTDKPFPHRAPASFEEIPLLKEFDHPIFSDEQAALLLSVGQPVFGIPGSVRRRQSIPIRQAITSPAFNTALDLFSPEDRVRTLELLKTSDSFGEYLQRHYVRLVGHVANEFVGKGIPFLDLLQEGRVSLMNAVNTYDIHRPASADTGKKAKFTTYAHKVIENAMKNSLKRRWEETGIPYHIAYAAKIFRDMTSDLTQILERTPTQNEQRAYMEAQDVFAPEILLFLLNEGQALLEPRSLNETTGQAGAGLELHHRIPSSENTETTALGNLGEDFTTLAKALAEIPQSLREALVLHQGLGGQEKLTFQEIGNRSGGVSRQRIAQREAQAVALLRASMLEEMGIDDQKKDHLPVKAGRSPFFSKEKIDERRRRVAKLHEEGYQGASIAITLGISPRLVSYDLSVLRDANVIKRPMTREEKLEEISRLEEQGRDLKEIAIRTNIGVDGVRRLLGYASALRKENSRAFERILKQAELKTADLPLALPDGKQSEN